MNDSASERIIWSSICRAAEAAMDESRYWSALEFRICREFRGMSEKRLHHYWCDGLDPEAYLLTERPPRIVGHAWICNGPEQIEWKFELYLPHSVESPQQIDWASLMPPEDMTRWLAIDENRRLIQIEPGAAIPDL